MRDSFFWLLAALLGLPGAIWSWIKRTFVKIVNKEKGDENG